MAERNYGYGPTDFEMKIATRENEVRAWVREMKRELASPKLTMGFGLYWRKNHRRAHTLSLALGKRVIVLDLEAIHTIPKELKTVLKKTMGYCVKPKGIGKKLGVLNLKLRGVRSVRKGLAKVIGEKTLIHGVVNPRAVVKSKGDDITYPAAYFAASEAYGCFCKAQEMTM